MSRAYVTRARVNRIAHAMTPLDHLILTDVARLNLLSGKQLRRLHYPDTETGRRRARADLRRLTDLRVLSRLERPIGGVRAGSDGFVYGLDVVGQRIAWPGRRRYRPPWTPQPMHLRHVLAVSELYVQMSVGNTPSPPSTIDNATTSTTYDLLFEAEPACWRPLPGSRQALKPDAYVELSTADYTDRYLVEIDRATESLTRIAAKTKQYVQYWSSGAEQATTGSFPLIVWVVPDHHRLERIVAVIGDMDASHWPLFRVVVHDHAAAALVSSELINQPKEVT